MPSKNVTKSKIGCNGFNQLKSGLTQRIFYTKVQCLIFLCTSNFLALIILQPETVKLRAPSKSYKELNLSRCSGGLSTGLTSTFM